MRENCIEWIEGDKTMTVTTYRKGLIRKIKAISEEKPEEVEIIKENQDGSICVHAPLEFLKIGPKKSYNLSEEKKQELRERCARMREARCGETP